MAWDPYLGFLCVKKSGLRSKKNIIAEVCGYIYIITFRGGGGDRPKEQPGPKCVEARAKITRECYNASFCSSLVFFVF